MFSTQGLPIFISKIIQINRAPDLKVKAMPTI